MVLCGVGAAVLATGHGHGGETNALLLLGAGLYGAHRVLRARGPLWLIGGLVVAWCLHRFWTFVVLKEPFQFEADHATLHAAPQWLAALLLQLVFVGVLVVGRARAGNGLMVLGLSALALSFVGRGILALADKDSSAEIVAGAMAEGWASVFLATVAMAWFAIGVGAVGATAPPRRLGIGIGVAGTALLLAALTGLPNHVSGGHDGAIALPVAALALGWVLTAVGLGGLARAGGGGLAWAGMGLCIFQVLVLPLGIALGDKSGQQLAAGIGAVLPFGFLGLGLGALAAPALAVRSARLVAATMFLVGVFGSTLAAVLVFASAQGILHVRDPFWSLDTVMRPAGSTALALWAASLAYLVSPPASPPPAP
jgi:hypothetical protein